MHRRFRATASLVLFGIALVASWSTSGCGTRDCAEERAGQVRCVANQVEVCNEDGTLTYEPCAPRGLFCSELRGACVTEDVYRQETQATSTVGAGGGSAASTTSSGPGGAGGS